MDVERVEGRLLGALAGWAAVSTLAGAALTVAGRRTRRRQAMAGFGLQSVLWGAVDGAIAASGLVRRRGREKVPDPRRLRRLLLVNVGADVGYVVLGALLRGHPEAAAARLRTSTPEALRGHGAAVVVQGAYLLVADALAAAALPRGSSTR